MGDLALVMFFVCMLMVPCYLASRNVRGKKAARRTTRPANGVFAVAETLMDEDSAASPCEPEVDRRALAIQRSREIFYRTGGKPTGPDYRPLAERDHSGERDRLAAALLRNRKAS